MKIICPALILGICLPFFSACQKQTSDAERQADVDREVQRRLEAEHQAQQQEDLTRREADLNAREQALANQQNATPSATPLEAALNTAAEAPAGERRGPAASYDTFYTKLQSYGDWLETSDYGYVFRPREAQRSQSWRPYTDGHWVYSDAGWAWVSDEPFGWAAYHYGRWTRLRNVGWVWVPGDEWAPAWVSWRKSDSYVGWAPLPPEARFDRRTGIHNWADNYYDIGPDNYCFVETRSFGTPRLQAAVVPAQQNVTIVNQTTNVTNITYNNTTVVNQGPNYEEIRTRSTEPIPRLRLEREVSVNINVGEPRAAIRGDVLTIPAPLIARAQAVNRPPTIKERVTNVVVERGWEAISDRPAAERARAKIRSEATPPPNAPPKTFIKPVEPAGPARPVVSATPATNGSPEQSASVAPNQVQPAATTSVTPLRRATPATNVSPKESASAAPNQVQPRASVTPFRRATPQPAATVTTTPAAASPAGTAAASATARPILSASPARPTMTPRVLPSPSATPFPRSVSPAHSPIMPAETRSPAGTARPENKGFDQHRTPPRALTTPTAAAVSPRPILSPAASASPHALHTPTTTPAEGAGPNRLESPPPRSEPRHIPSSPAASPATSPRSATTPQPAASPSGAANGPAAGREQRHEAKREEKAERQRERREGAEANESGSPSPSATAR